ncbi:glutamine ABC transporter ATP-binding protein [Clostridia bacterium]|nr:glutamine ABC transporter ATP-binding protein [Clostridia bacterium]
MSKKILEVKHLQKCFGEKEILKNVSFSIQEGEVLVLLGPSGSGKSTLLRTLNGLESIQKGEIYFQGELLKGEEKQWQAIRQKIAMVFQNYELFPNLTVMENLLLSPTKVQKREKTTVEKQAKVLLERIGLGEKLKSYPRELSGGQKQRVAIVRALVMEPTMILFDEVTASLDPEMVREVLEMIQDLAKERKTMMVVTHEIDFARRVADRVIFMEEGEIISDYTAQEFFEEQKNERITRFLNSLTH